MKSKPFSERWAERLEYLASRSIVCIDPEWRGSNARYHFRCELGHEWSRQGRTLTERLDCRSCGLLEKSAVRCWPAMIEAGRANGTVCLDTRWLGHRHRYRFRCKEGHEWLRTGTSQIRHPTCLECFRQQVSDTHRRPDILQKLHDVACQRGGACLSTTYHGTNAYYAFRCAQGHEWQTRAPTVLTGSWCPPCDEAERAVAMRLPDGLERMRRMASERGGQCLSDTYLGGAVKYPFRCARGHEWKKSGNKLFLGSWCQPCAFDAKRLSIEHAHEAARAKGGLCLSQTYINSNLKLMWRCDRGHEWATTLSQVRQGHWCRTCANMARITNRNSKARLKYDDAGARRFDLPKQDK